MKSTDQKYIICYNAKLYCKEDISLIENYELMINDYTQRWVCHHRREIDEHKTMNELLEEGLYYNVPAAELIFMTASDHMALHKKDKPMSEEHKQHLFEALTGLPKSEEHKQHLSEALTGVPKSEEHKHNISEAMKCLKWWNNGVKQVRAKECPGPGFTRGRTKKETSL